MGWLRLYAEMATDPKFQLIARRVDEPPAMVIGVFTHMLCHAEQRRGAARGTLDGWSEDRAAITLGIEATRIARIRAAMEGLVLAGDAITGWSRRQFPTDSSTDRTRAWRARRKAAREAVAHPVTIGTVTSVRGASPARHAPAKPLNPQETGGRERACDGVRPAVTQQIQNRSTPLTPLGHPQAAELLAEEAKRARARLASRAAGKWQ